MNSRFMCIVVIAAMAAAAPALATPAGGAVAATPAGGATAAATPAGGTTAAATPTGGATAAVPTAPAPKPPKQFKPKKNIKSQGAVHANPGAILNVCSKTTPAAQRSALCPPAVPPVVPPK